MINDMLLSLIRAELQSRKDRHGWDTGQFANIQQLSADKRGEVGEQFIEAALIEIGVQGVCRSGETDRTKKHWDIRTNDMDIEVKTATIGRNNNRFQHENIEKDRNYHALIFLDITPDVIYITPMPKHLVPWKTVHRRAASTAYKWDFNLKDVENNKVESLDDIRNMYKYLCENITK